MHKKTLFSRAGRFAVAVSGALALAGAALPANASTLRIAMTAADIPLTLGQPDQGYEGNRFTGIPLYDALVEWDLSQGEKPSGLVPGLATEWHIDPQNTSRWIFTLRPGVKFHDGTEVNADAIVWNVDKVLNKAAPQYAPGQIGNTLSRMPTLTGAEKIDDHTVALTTSEPDALLPYNITNLFIVSPTAWQKQYDAVPASVRDSAARSKQAWTAFAAHAVGSGPFKLEKLVPRQQLILDKNPDYWNKDRIPRVDKVVLIPLPEANARTAALLSKKALMRPIGSHNDNERAASLEKMLEDGINKIGLGPQGMSGNTSVMGVNIENTARHPSTIGVAVNVGCWSHRKGHIVFDKDLNYTITSHTGVAF